MNLKLVKCALIRTKRETGDDYYLAVRCQCGRRPAVNIDIDNDIAICGCGTTYNNKGWIIQ